MCGEKRGLILRITGYKGSPPHVRRKVSKRFFLGAAYRITPACAGKRAAHSFQAVPPWDHPRMCGEKVAMVTTAVSTPGSPPHVRGKANLHQCAPRYTQDHPRMCGEKGSAVSGFFIWLGSPPHVRGKARHAH